MLFLSILAAPHHSGYGSAESDDRALISEFYPCGLCSDEYFAIVNSGTAPLSLENWTVTDGEGSLRFCCETMMPPGKRIVASSNASSFKSAFGEAPDISLSNRTAVASSGTFRLADGGDTIALVRPDGTVADLVAYGDTGVPAGWVGQPVPRIRSGEVVKRALAGQSLKDTDSAVDWFCFREYRYGFTEFPVFGARIGGGALTAFVSPDCSLEVILSGIGSAEDSVRICTYELDSAPVCLALVDACSRGVTICVLVDGAPAGGLQSGEIDRLSALVQAGVQVRLVNGNLTKDSVQHVGALHAKYMVVDDSESFIISENFVRSGLSEDGLFGNRGWGVKVDDPDLAEFLAALFESDSRSDRPDVIDWSSDPRYNRSAEIRYSAARTAGLPAVAPCTSQDEAWVQAFVSPDASVNEPFLVQPIRSSRELLLSQFQVETAWNYRWTGEHSSPLIDSVVTAMRGGAHVRGVFDSSWYNLEANERVVAILSGIARNESLNGTFKQIDTRGPISILHNKGALLDSKRTLVSSNNWCLASFSKNRELALLIDSSEVASYFVRAFEMDWVPDGTPPNAQAGPDRRVLPGERVVLDAGLSSDDRAVADLSWDLGGDGTVDSTDLMFNVSFDKDGRYEVVLRVSDAWGNEGVDTVYIYVGAGSDRALSWPASGPWWAFLASGGAGAATGMMLARKRIRSQKFNHGGEG